MGGLEVVSGVGGCQGGWEWRIEAFVKIQKEIFFFFFFGGGGGVGLGGGDRVDVNGEVMLFEKKFFFFLGGGGGVGRVRGGGGVGLGGVRVDGNGELKLL